MEKKILIVQSIPKWLNMIRGHLKEKSLSLIEGVNIVFTDSFDHAVDIVPTNCELLVISSEEFHDNLSIHKSEPKMANVLKDSNALAILLKQKNSHAIIHVFSEYAPKEVQNIDGYIAKVRGDEYIGLEKIAELIKEFLK